MTCTTEVVLGSGSGDRKLRAEADRRLRAAQALNQERASQFLPHQRRDVVYVSRLQCVQTAIESQLQRLAQTAPTTRVCLITFSSDVVIHGDASAEPLVIAGSKLESRDTVEAAAAAYEFATSLKPISESRAALTKRVKEL